MAIHRRFAKSALDTLQAALHTGRWMPTESASLARALFSAIGLGAAPSSRASAPSFSGGARAFSSGLGFEHSYSQAPQLGGKTFLVTGSTDGIGLHTATLLAQQGATTLVHGRSLSKVKRTIKQIRAHTGNAAVYGYCADFSSLEGVFQLADHVHRDLHRVFGGELHCLLNNAGVFLEEKEASADGLEMTWAVNTAAPFLLTSLLLPHITHRVVNSSSISLADTIDLSIVTADGPFERSGHAAYGNSKLGVNMWSYMLAERLRAAGSPVTVNCVDPGTVSTKLLYAGWGDVSYVALQPSEAEDEFWACSDPALAGVSGKYFVNRKSRPSPPSSYDVMQQQTVWDLLEAQTGARFDEAIAEAVALPEAATAVGDAAAPAAPRRPETPREGIKLQQSTY